MVWYNARMKRTLKLGLGAALLLLAGCADVAPPTFRVPPTLPPPITPAPIGSPTAPSSDVRRITPADLAAAMARGQVLVLDVRLPGEYAIRRLPGAQLLPAPTSAATLPPLPHDRLLVTYCACSDDGESVAVARLLRGAGYADVAALAGGLTAWEDTGRPLDTTPPASTTPYNGP
jgi:rhodanese-related sulfurtransferase